MPLRLYNEKGELVTAADINVALTLQETKTINTHLEFLIEKQSQATWHLGEINNGNHIEEGEGE